MQQNLDAIFEMLGICASINPSTVRGCQSLTLARTTCITGVECVDATYLEMWGICRGFQFPMVRGKWGYLLVNNPRRFHPHPIHRTNNDCIVKVLFCARSWVQPAYRKRMVPEVTIQRPMMWVLTARSPLSSSCNAVISHITHTTGVLPDALFHAHTTLHTYFHHRRACAVRGWQWNFSKRYWTDLVNVTLREFGLDSSCTAHHIIHIKL